MFEETFSFPPILHPLKVQGLWGKVYINMMAFSLSLASAIKAE